MKNVLLISLAALLFSSIVNAADYIDVHAEGECRKTHKGGCTAWATKSYVAPAGKLISQAGSNASVLFAYCKAKQTTPLIWKDTILVNTPYGILPHSTGVTLNGECQSGSGFNDLNQVFKLVYKGRLA